MLHLELQSLSKISMRIPTFVQSGETADLTCSYYLDSDKLYSIKWYKVSKFCTYIFTCVIIVILNIYRLNYVYVWYIQKK